MTREVPKTLQDTLLELCRRGVLLLGLEDGEYTYSVTEDFAKTLTKCTGIILRTGGYDDDPIGIVAFLALVDWCGPLTESELRRLGEAIRGVLVSSLEGSP